jgi:branched-chain amino acid aminotransferase
METTTVVNIHRTGQSRLPASGPDLSEFGRTPTDHMFIARYAGGEWGEARIEPFQDLRLSPFTLALHYAQTIFEGLKAFRRADGRVSIFRAEANWERMNFSAARMCMPSIPRELFMEGLIELTRLDQDWTPVEEGAALYLRPFMFASDARLGVHVGREYLFLIVATPVREIYPHPLKVKVELKYARAVKGGTGAAKCGGNYAGALYPTMLAQREGFDQVLWTDGRYHRFIEESGTMNVMCVIDDKLVTPPLNDAILAGITRDSLLNLARDMDIPVEERPLSVAELESTLADGRLTEAFGVGTAAVVAPIQEIAVRERRYSLSPRLDNVMFRLKRRLNDIRTGKLEDTRGWNWVID